MNATESDSTELVFLEIASHLGYHGYTVHRNDDNGLPSMNVFDNKNFYQFTISTHSGMNHFYRSFEFHSSKVDKVKIASDLNIAKDKLLLARGEFHEIDENRSFIYIDALRPMSYDRITFGSWLEQWKKDFCVAGRVWADNWISPEAEKLDLDNS